MFKQEAYGLLNLVDKFSYLGRNTVSSKIVVNIRLTINNLLILVNCY